MQSQARIRTNGTGVSKCFVYEMREEGIVEVDRGEAG